MSYSVAPKLHIAGGWGSVAAKTLQEYTGLFAVAELLIVAAWSRT